MPDPDTPDLQARFDECERFAQEGWAWVDDFCEALGEGTTVFNFKERIKAERERRERAEGVVEAAETIRGSLAGSWAGKVLDTALANYAKTTEP